MVGRTVFEIVRTLAERAGERPAILSRRRAALSFAGLLRQIESTICLLNNAGITQGQRVAVVLPNGPEMAVAFLAVSSACTCAPLNPAYRADEFTFFVEDLDASALIVLRGMPSPARAIAEQKGIPIVELVPNSSGPSGEFTLEVSGTGFAGSPQLPSSDDIALVLHTSGTTSRPKIVPLSHGNLAASAEHISYSLRLTPDDCCLNVMPLFHIHGLIGAVLSSLAAGASVVCTTGFDAPRFFDWMEEFHPTWYTAVPSMHQAILARVPENRDRLINSRLRLIRSSSSSLPPQVMAQLEESFGVPVIESYGMTEASHQMATNPLPPAKRKPGSVGLPAGPQVAVMDDAGNLLSGGAVGEVVIQGPNVTSGYANNPAANQSAFQNGWFRTGDQGYLDSDGYLFLTGRLKEIINRGGEKISPREIDEVLLDHSSVAQAVAFACPDPALGEDVAAAVVLRPGATADEMELREFAAARLADFKVPRRILILAEIPKGPTGKLQRIGLSEKLGLTHSVPPAKAAVLDFGDPRTKAEALVCDIWKDVLVVDRVGVHDDFFTIGGDSVLAVQMLARIESMTDVQLSIVRFSASPTVAAVASWLEQARASDEAPRKKAAN